MGIMVWWGVDLLHLLSLISESDAGECVGSIPGPARAAVPTEYGAVLASEPVRKPLGVREVFVLARSQTTIPQLSDL
jgi:hypothetical protein